MVCTGADVFGRDAGGSAQLAGSRAEGQHPHECLLHSYDHVAEKYSYGNWSCWDAFQHDCRPTFMCGWRHLANTIENSAMSPACDKK